MGVKDFLFPIVFPDYQITIDSDLGITSSDLGHAGVLAVNGETGLAVYYEYGRYERDSNGDEIGAVRKITISDAVIENGQITQNSLNTIAEFRGHETQFWELRGHTAQFAGVVTVFYG